MTGNWLICRAASPIVPSPKISGWLAPKGEASSWPGSKPLEKPNGRLDSKAIYPLLDSEVR
jgi:hypothetical protein